MQFKEIYGHASQYDILRSAVLRNRIPHAYLFYGMEGIGKKTVAERYAKSILCLNKMDGFEACDICSSCQKVDRKNHPDFIIIKADGQFIRIKEIRYLQEQMSYSPLEAERRVIIIEDADKMNNVSANAMLKTLEEPAKSNILILLTANPRQIPATVFSRCQKIKFNPIPASEVALFLQNKLSIDSEKAFKIASVSGGRIQKALELTEDTYMIRKIDFFKKVAESHKKGQLKMLSLLSEFGQDKTEIMESLSILMTGFRDTLVYKETEDVNRMVNKDCVSVIKSLACDLSPFEILQNIRAVDWATRVIGLNANKQLTLETMVFKFHYRS